jgi:hypothetical protein
MNTAVACAKDKHQLTKQHWQQHTNKCTQNQLTSTSCLSTCQALYRLHSTANRVQRHNMHAGYTIYIHCSPCILAATCHRAVEQTQYMALAAVHHAVDNGCAAPSACIMYTPQSARCMFTSQSVVMVLTPQQSTNVP